MVELGETVTAAAVRELLDRHPDVELRFVQHRLSRVVHVVMPHDPDADADKPPKRDLDSVAWIGWLVGATATVCGYVARHHFGSQPDSDELVTTFADELLCRRCWRVLGPHAARAFEHPLPQEGHDG